MDDGEVLVDVSQNGLKAKINWPIISDDVPSELDCFHMAFPMNKLDSYVDASNECANAGKHGYGNQAEITKEDFMKYLSIRLIHTLDGAKYPIDECWSTNNNDDSSLKVPQNYRARLGMSKNRFKFINACFRITNYDDATLKDVIILYYH